MQKKNDEIKKYNIDRKEINFYFFNTNMPNGCGL